MPDRIVRKSVEWVGEHRNVVLTLGLFAMVAFAIFAAIGWSKAAEAKRDAANALVRVASVENERKQERAARDAANRTAEVALCFSSARNRPRLLLVLNALNGVTSDIVTRTAIAGLIHDYGTQPVQGIKGMPSRDKCVALANQLDIDVAPYDFDPATGELVNPPEDSP